MFEKLVDQVVVNILPTDVLEIFFICFNFLLIYHNVPATRGDRGC